MAQSTAVTSVDVPISGTFQAGDFLDFRVHFSNAVDISGTSPSLGIDIGGVTRFANLISSSGSSVLVFEYVVASGDNDADGITLGTLGPPGSIVDGSFLDADLTLNSVGVTTGVIVNTVIPTVTISTTAPSVVTADTMPLTITFSEAVTGFSAGSIAATNATVDTLQTLDNITYTALAHYVSEGPADFSVPSNAVINAGNNGNAASKMLAVTFTLAPIATDSSANVPYDQATTITPSLAGVAATTLNVISGASHGVLTVSGTSFSYTPDPGTTVDSFTYTADNAYGTSALATVTITVTQPNITLTPAAGTLAAGQVGTAWSALTFTAANGTAPYAFATTGTLPPGLTLAPTGALSGTPTASGSFTFDVSATDSYGAVGTATYTIAVSPVLGSITLRQRADGDDAVFGFTSPESALNLSIATNNGAGESAPIQLAAGTYSVIVDDMSGAGFGLTSLACSDTDSTTDIAHRTATIALAAGEAVVCTFTSLNTAERTGELVEQFLGDRAELVLNSQPDMGRNIDRLNGVMSGGGNPGSALLGYVSRLADSGSLTVNTSLAAIDAMAGAEKQSRFDAWFSGTFARLDSGNGDGTFATAAMGADYLLTPDLLIGAFTQFDRTSAHFDGTDATGTGWLLGPYATARLGDNLYLDLLAAAGRSSNSISPFGTYSDDFDATRYLLSATLQGQWQWEAWTFSPRARVSYFGESSDGYTDSLGVAIDPVTAGKGQVAVGPGISYRFVMDGEIAVNTSLRLDGIADIANDGGTPLDDLHGRLEGSLSIGFTQGADLAVNAAYDGLGEDSHTTSGRISASLPIR